VLLYRMHSVSKIAGNLPVFAFFAIYGQLRFSSHTSIVPDYLAGQEGYASGSSIGAVILPSGSR
jgi:hypothetical protein